MTGNRLLLGLSSFLILEFSIVADRYMDNIAIVVLNATP